MPVKDRNLVLEAGLPGIHCGTWPTIFSQGKDFQFKCVQAFFFFFLNDSTVTKVLRSAPVQDVMFLHLKTVQ